MPASVPKRFVIQRVILAADRGLQSLGNIDGLTAPAAKGDRRLAVIPAVPARSNAEPADTFRTG